MKKIIAVMCAGILCLSLAACGNNNAGSDAPQEQTQAKSSENTSEEATAQVDDTQSKSTEGIRIRLFHMHCSLLHDIHFWNIMIFILFISEESVK